MGRIGGYDVPVANLPYTLASDAASKMAADFEDGRFFAATYYDTGTDRVYSLRSCPHGMDVSQIAASYGGGGHRNAAGFKIPLMKIFGADAHTGLLEETVFASLPQEFDDGK